jgi:hypothetical protein
LAVSAIRAGISLETVRWVPFLASIALQILTLLALPLLWGKLLMRLERRNGIYPASYGKFDLYKSYSRSWLARYIPGRIWMMGGRMAYAARYGISIETVARGMAFEMIFTYGFLTALGTGLILASRVHFLIGMLTFASGVAALILAVAFSQHLPGWHRVTMSRNRILSKLGKFTHRVLVGASPLSLPTTLWGVAAYGTYSALQLVFIVLLAEGFADLSLHQAMLIAGAWGIGSVLGYFAFIAPGPGGLGIRDGITLILFAQVIDLPTAALVVAVSRLVMIGSDAAFVGIIELLNISRIVAQRFRSLPVESPVS